MVSDFSKIGRQVAADIVVDPDHGEGDFTTIQAGIDALGTSGGTVFVRDSTYYVSSAITLESDIDLIFSKGAKMILSGGNHCIEVNGKTDVSIIGARIDLNKENYVGAYHGIYFHNSADRFKIKDCVIQNASIYGFGIFIDDCVQGNIEESRVTDGQYSGIRLESCQEINIESCELLENLQSNSFGIALILSNQCNVVNNFCWRNGYDGIYLYGSKLNRISSNFLIENAQSVSGSYDGIRLFASDSNIISTNHCYDAQASKTQRYGINIATATCDWNLIDSNWLKGNLTAAYSDSGTNTTIGTNVT